MASMNRTWVKLKARRIKELQIHFSLIILCLILSMWHHVLRALFGTPYSYIVIFVKADLNINGSRVTFIMMVLAVGWSRSVDPSSVVWQGECRHGHCSRWLQ